MKRSQKTIKSRQIDLLALLAFIVVIISAITWVLTNIGANVGVLSAISVVCLYIVVLWSGWMYASKLSKTWQVIYLVIAVLTILSAFGIKF